MATCVVIADMEDAHKHMSVKLRNGNDLTLAEIAELFDNHSKLLKAYRLLEKRLPLLDFDESVFKSQVEYTERTTDIKLIQKRKKA